MDVYVGIDLGTTNSSCAICTQQADGRLFIHQLPIRQLTGPLNEDHPFGSDNILPSVVWLRDGKHAYTGRYCKTLGGQLLQHPGSRIVRSIKRKMGDSRWSVQVENQRLEPGEVSALLLRTIRESLELDNHGWRIARVAIGIPACFSSQMRRETVRAAELAGFDPDTLSLVDEPIAALFSRAERSDQFLPELPRPANVLVFDMGGGTLDVSVIRLADQHRELEILSTSRYNEVAGDDLDLEIASLCVKAARNTPGYNRFLELTDQAGLDKRQALGWGLMEAAEALKIDLAEVLETGPRRGDFQHKLRHYRTTPVSITADFSLDFDTPSPGTLDLRVCDLLDAVGFIFSVEADAGDGRSMFVPISEAIERSGLTPEEVGSVFITGGSAYFPPVIDALAAYFYEQPQRLDPFYSVARGAAAWALLSAEGSWSIREKTHDSLFLKRTGHPFLKILNPVSIPSSPQIVAIPEDDCPCLSRPGNELRLEFFQGTSEHDPLMTLSHVETVHFSRELEEGARLVEVTGHINRNKVYEFTFVFEDKTGRIPAQVFFSGSSLISDEAPTIGTPLILNEPRP